MCRSVCDRSKRSAVGERARRRDARFHSQGGGWDMKGGKSLQRERLKWTKARTHIAWEQSNMGASSKTMRHLNGFGRRTHIALERA